MPTPQLTSEAFTALLPIILLTLTAFFVLLWDTLLRPHSKNILMLFSLAGVGAAAATMIVGWSQQRIMGSYFGGHLVIDRFGLYFGALILLVVALVFLTSKDFLDREEIHVGEYHALVLFAAVGMILLALAGDLITIFIGIELMSLAVYVLVAFNRSDYRCIEGALKYLVLGSFASAILLYGIALLYGMTGTTALKGIEAAMNRVGDRDLVQMGIALLLVGFAFKIGAFPFHMWAPDVYEGASTPVTAAMATGVKIGAFAALIRTFSAIGLTSAGQEVIAFLAGSTMILGNIGAIRQTNVKRMLAYSSVAHSGYLLSGLLAVESYGKVSSNGVSAMLFYLTAYAFMTLGAFSIITLIGRKEEEPLRFEQWAGLGFRHPWLGVAMTIFLVSLGGLPPTAGFFAKFYLFSAVVDAGYVPLVVLAVLTSAASFYYYLRIVVQMYMKEGELGWSPRFTPLLVGSVSVMAILTLWLGLLPSGPLSVLEWTRDSVAGFL